MHPISVIRDEKFVLHLDRMPHLESFRRITAINETLGHTSLDGRWQVVSPRLASRDELALVHTRSHIERIARSAGHPMTSFDPDTQATGLSYEVACLGVGGVFSLLDTLWQNGSPRGFALVRPPGHHAEPDKPMGFCLFNNAALGAAYLQTHYGVKKIMIVDIDAHHGNGTQSTFYGTDQVLYVSMHQFPGFPGTGNFNEVGAGRGEGYTVNVPLGKGCGDRDFARIIHFLLNPLAKAYEPEIILVSCGFDLYLHDRLGGMRATPEGYALMTFFLLDIAAKFCNGRIAFIMEGGYSLRGIRECGLRVFQELCEVPTLTRKKIDRITQTRHENLSTLKKVIGVQKKYWKILR